MKSKKYLHITPLFYSIGDAAEQIYWASVSAASSGKKINIISPYDWTQVLSYKICNKELFRLNINEDKGFDAISFIYLSIVRLFVNLYFFLRRVISLLNRKYFHYQLNEEWSFPFIGMQSYWIPTYSKNLDYSKIILNERVCNTFPIPSIGIRNKIECACSKKLFGYGIPNDAKYVCLHVRDAGFHGDEKRRSYRNADIDNYQKGISYLIDKGFYVFRMGDSKMRKMNKNNERLIDYPFTSLKSEEMDLYLIKNCQFYIGMQSGIYSVAALFNKPILLLNMISWFYPYPFKSCDRGMLKKLKIGNSGHPLTLKDWFNLPFNYLDANALLLNDFIFIEHNPDEILNAITEYHLDYESGFTRPLSPFQIDAFDNYRKASRLIMNNENPVITGNFFLKAPTEITRLAMNNMNSFGALYDF